MPCRLVRTRRWGRMWSWSLDRRPTDLLEHRECGRQVGPPSLTPRGRQDLTHSPDTSRTVSLGYQSFNSASVSVPAGVDNKISYGAADQGQPTTFLPGSHDNAFALTMTNAEYQAGNWYLVSATANLTSNGTPCTIKPVPVSAGSPIAFLGTTAVVTVVGAGLLTRRRRPKPFASAA
jgi:hypothetical protein